MLVAGNSMELELEECTSESVIQFYRGKKWWIQSMIKRSRYKRHISSSCWSVVNFWYVLWSRSGSGSGSWSESWAWYRSGSWSESRSLSGSGYSSGSLGCSYAGST